MPIMTFNLPYNLNPYFLAIYYFIMGVIFLVGAIILLRRKDD